MKVRKESNDICEFLRKKGPSHVDSMLFQLLFQLLFHCTLLCTHDFLLLHNAHSLSLGFGLEGQWTLPTWISAFGWVQMNQSKTVVLYSSTTKVKEARISTTIPKWDPYHLSHLNPSST
jgi:hypothetical protein